MIELKYMMTNQEIAKILYEISEYLAMQDVAFKPRAYEKAADSIEAFEEDISDVYKKGGIKALEEIPGVGAGIAERIEELIKTGHLKYYDQLKKKMPIKLSELTAVEGIGPKMIMKLYKSLGVRNLKDLEKVAKAGKVHKLEGFGEKSEENILQGIEFLKRSGGRFVLGFVLPQIREIEQRIKDIKGVKQAVVSGSIRRMKETIGDGDILVTVASHQAAKEVTDFFINLPEVVHVYSHGETKSSVRLKNGMDFDLRVVPDESFGAALQYFTGNKDHNIELRKIAIERGLKLNEYGVFSAKGPMTRDSCRSGPASGWRRIAGHTEEDVYRALGLRWMEPELRTNTGEIEASFKNKLPKIIGYKDLKGDLQIQTNWTDGSNSLEDYVKEAMKIGLEYIAITDHTKTLAMTGGLDERGLEKQGREIDKINFRLRQPACRQGRGFGGQVKFKVLKSAEVNILKDGKLDINDETLKKLDLVAIAVHSGFKTSKKEMTERIVRAMKNSNADILFHPTGRLINQRPPYEVDIERIIKVAKETGTVLEIDAYPNRLDLKDEHIRMAVEAGVKLAIDSDAHNIFHLRYLEFGIAQARRGWATKNDVVNTRPVDQFLKFLK